MKKFLKEVAIFIMVITLILYTYGLFCEWFFKKDQYLPGSDSRRFWAMKLSGNSFDYAVLGSSRAEGAFDMNMLDSAIGLKGINIGADGSGYVDNYLVLNKFLKNKNKINYLFLQTDIYSLAPARNFSNAFHVYDFIPYWKDPIYKTAISHYLDCTDNFLFSHIPWLRFYKYNKYFSPLQAFLRMKEKNNHLKRLDQNNKSTNIKPFDYMIDSSRFFKPKGSKSVIADSFDVGYLSKIFDLATKNGIKVICFTAPDFYYQKEIFSNYNAVNNKLLSFIQNKNIIYLPHTDSISKNIFFFRDPGHLTDYGRFAHTNSFAQYFKCFIKSKSQ